MYCPFGKRILNIQGGSKIGTIFVRLNFTKYNRFLKLFHCQNQAKICNKLPLKIPTCTSQVYRYTTLWNVKCLKSNNWKQDDVTFIVTKFFIRKQNFRKTLTNQMPMTSVMTSLDTGRRISKYNFEIKLIFHDVKAYKNGANILGHPVRLFTVFFIVLLRKQVSLDAAPSKCIPPPRKCTWCRCWPWPLTFDLWVWKPCQQCPLTRWILVPSLIEISPLSIKILCHAKW